MIFSLCAWRTEYARDARRKPADNETRARTSGCAPTLGRPQQRTSRAPSQGGRSAHTLGKVPAVLARTALKRRHCGSGPPAPRAHRVAGALRAMFKCKRQARSPSSEPQQRVSGGQPLKQGPSTARSPRIHQLSAACTADAPCPSGGASWRARQARRSRQPFTASSTGNAWLPKPASPPWRHSRCSKAPACAVSSAT